MSFEQPKTPERSSRFELSSLVEAPSAGPSVEVFASAEPQKGETRIVETKTHIRRFVLKKDPTFENRLNRAQRIDRWSGRLMWTGLGMVLATVLGGVITFIVSHTLGASAAAVAGVALPWLLPIAIPLIVMGIGGKLYAENIEPKREVVRVEDDTE